MSLQPPQRIQKGRSLKNLFKRSRSVISNKIRRPSTQNVKDSMNSIPDIVVPDSNNDEPERRNTNPIANFFCKQFSGSQVSLKSTSSKSDGSSLPSTESRCIENEKSETTCAIQTTLDSKFIVLSVIFLITSLGLFTYHLNHVSNLTQCHALSNELARLRGKLQVFEDLGLHTQQRNETFAEISQLLKLHDIERQYSSQQLDLIDQWLCQIGNTYSFQQSLQRAEQLMST